MDLPEHVVMTVPCRMCGCTGGHISVPWKEMALTCGTSGANLVVCPTWSCHADILSYCLKALGREGDEIGPDECFEIRVNSLHPGFQIGYPQ